MYSKALAPFLQKMYLPYEYRICVVRNTWVKHGLRSPRKDVQGLFVLIISDLLLFYFSLV